jgi:argininosuccinate lyase
LAGNRLWGGRFTGATDPLFAAFNDSLSFDKELLEADIQGSIAYARGLERAGVFTRRERARVERGLKRVLADCRRDPGLVANSDAEDVHTFVEQALKQQAGDLALKLHTGRSRNDQVATDLRLYLREKETGIASEMDQLLETVAGAAEAHDGIVIPGYTHLQRAQPVLFSHYLLAFGEMLLRDRDRLREAKARANICPLGSGALSGTVYAVDREALARDLGFDGITRNSMDAVADRDCVLDFLYFASTLLMHLSRLAEDLVIYSSAEFGFVTLKDSVTSGSSLMPQKKNPDALELIRGKAGRVFGRLTGLLTVLKGLPMTYNKDLQEDKEALFDAVRTVEDCVRMMRLVLQSTVVRGDRMRAACVDGYLNATELADYLVARKMTFREAHQLVGKIVVRALELDLPLEKLPLTVFRSFSPLFDEDVYECLQLERVLARRTAAGGTSPSAVKKALEQFRGAVRQKNRQPAAGGHRVPVGSRQ